MEKITFMRLWDLYNGLLTPTQQEITDLYFNKDLTLSEIAEEKGITRQGVSECLKACKKQLEEYDERLNFFSLLDEGNRQTRQKLADISKWIEMEREIHPEMNEELKVLKGIVESDYADKV
jgi:hypothetical protein